ncbi:MAG: putative porin [bacterium]
MQKLIGSFLFFILIPFLADSFPVKPDSSTVKKDSTRVLFFYNDIDREGKLKVHAYDTALTGIQNYNLLTRYDGFFATLGNIGSAYLNLFPYPFWNTGGFDFGTHSFDQYLFQNDSVKYYRILKTFTELEYVQGAKKELNFRAKFSRNIYRGLNLGFDFHVSNSPGAYLRQKTNLVNFVVTTQFLSKTKRYGLIANFLFNRIKDQENGGIKYDSLFEQNLESNRQVIPVNLSDAQNRVKETGCYIKQFFDLTRHEPKPADSGKTGRKRLELGRITYSFQYNRKIFNYLDGAPASGFYTNIYMDSLDTYDSITIKKIENRFSWTNPSFDPNRKYRRIQLEVSLKHQYVEVHYPGRKHFYFSFDPASQASVEIVHPGKSYFLNQIIPSAWISFRPYSTFILEAFADYVIGDYNEGDMGLQVRISQILGKANRNLGSISLEGHYSYRKPDWFYAHYQSNNFEWNHDWERQGLISAAAIYGYKFLQLGASMSRLTNYVYLDTGATPNQETGEIGYICSWLNTDIDLWRFKFKGQFVYQTVKGSNAIRVPAFIGSLAIYFTQPLFKGVTTIQPGLNFYYNTAYFAEGYIPATRMFYLQDQKKIGNYLYMDVFLNVKIQRVRIFITYTHFNASFMGRNYFTVPHDPMQDAALKFGISWRFFD